MVSLAIFYNYTDTKKKFRTVTTSLSIALVS